MKYRCYFIILFTISVFEVKAQDSNSNMRGNCIRNFSREIGVKSQIGYLMAHHTQMYYLIQGHVKSMEIYYEKVVSGNKNWHHVYRLPVVGFSAYFADLGNKSNMGYAISLFPYIKYHLIKRNRFELNSRLGTGLAYLTKYFDKTENNKNSAIAAPLNVCLNLSLEPEFKFKKFDAGIGLQFTHFSNGAFKTPNLGFNIPSIFANIGFRFNHATPMCKKEKALTDFRKRNSIEISGFVGLKENQPSNGPKYFVGNINMMYRRNYHPKSNLLFFSDINYNQAYLKSYENHNKVSENNFKAVRISAGIGYGLSMDKTMFFIQNGFYVFDALKFDKPMHFRIGSRYNFDNGLLLNLSFKTHAAKADVIEFGAGYTFPILKNKIKQVE